MALKAYCDKEKLDKLLDGRTKKWLCDRLNEIGIDIEYKTLIAIYNNHNEWKLTYAMGLCKVFNLKVEDIFFLK